MPFTIRPFHRGIYHLRPDMKFKPVFALFPLLLLGAPIYAQALVQNASPQLKKT